MGEKLQERLQQKTFSSPYQEAMLNLLVCADFLNRRMEELCTPYGITAAQYNVLRILRGVYPEGHPRCEIIERMIQVAPDVTRLIDRLARSGFVRRGKSSNDGRLSLTFITQAGLDLLTSMQKDIQDLDSGLMNRMSDKDARTLSRLCEKVYGG